MLSSYLYWQFVDSPKKLWHIIVQTQIYFFNTFSIGYLFRTLFAPWKRDIVSVVNPTIADHIRIFAENAISRFFGFLMRSMTIIAGFIIIIFTSIVSVLLFVIWIAMPFVIIYLISRSIVFF